MKTGEREVEAAYLGIKKIATLLKCCFLVALIAYGAFAAIMLLGSILSDLFPDRVSFTYLSGVFDSLAFGIHGVLVLALFWCGYRIFKDISSGASPFSVKQSNRIQAAALLFVVYAVLDLIWCPQLLSLLSIGTVDIGYQNLTSGPLVLQLDTGVLAAAAMLFCLSLIFRYGAVLQRLSDDIV